MTEIHVTEKHSVSTVGTDQAEAKIEISSTFPYKFVRNVEDEIYKFVENLKKINGGAPGLANASYSEEEIQVIHGSTRENVWERYQEAFPKSRRTRVGVISYFKKWVQFEKLTKSARKLTKKISDEVKKEIAPEAPTKLNAWQRKFILKHAQETDTPGKYSGLGKFHIKWPGIKLDGEMIQAVLAAGPKKKEPEPKKPKTKDPEPALVLNSPVSKFKVGDKVVQANGFSPAHGVGEVQKIRDDGVITVKFLSSTKVLQESCFEIAEGE
jgi:hypothetical protein